MPGTRHAATTILLLAGLSCASSLQAQESTTRGFNVGLHFTAATLDLENGDRYNAGGGGLTFGYGFNRSFELFLQIDGSEFDVEDADVEGRWTMGHLDLGVRYHFANSLRTWIPYLEAAITGRGVSVEDAVVDGTPETDVALLGGGPSLGGGIMFYFRQTLAADLQLEWTGGEFSEVRVNNVTASGLDFGARSTRLSLGVSWWP